MRTDVNGKTEPPYLFSTWKKVLCLLALCMIVAGGALTLFESSPREGKTEETPGPKAQAFLPEGLPAPAPQEASPWGPALLKGGAGLLIGFAMGYALRTVFRFVVLALGFALLGLVALQYADWINIQWSCLLYTSPSPRD